jgi:acyl carrier protein
MTDTALSTDILNQVIAAIVEVSPDTEQVGLSSETTFESIDVDSLDLVEIAQIVGDEHNIKISGDGLEDLRTIGDAVALIASKTA